MSQGSREITKSIKEARVRLFITDKVIAEARNYEKAEGVVTDEPVVLDRVIGRSALNFIGCDYMKMSAWFKSQTAHTFVGLAIRDSDDDTLSGGVRMVLRKRKDDGYEICSMTEQELPADYYETRVVEETKVIYRDLLKS